MIGIEIAEKFQQNRPDTDQDKEIDNDIKAKQYINILTHLQ